jgi:hypothetical protein
MKLNRLQAGALLLACAACGAQEPLASGLALPVRSGGGLGLLAAPRAITTKPVGAANVFGGKRPDLFVAAPTGVEQALLLYRWVRDTASGAPVFAPPVKVAHPFGDKAPPDSGTVFQDASGEVVGLWMEGKTLRRCRFDRGTSAFLETARVEVGGLPRPTISLAVLSAGPDGVELAAACYNGAKYRPAGDARSLDYVLYDGSGAFRGQWPRSGLYRFRLAAGGSQALEPARLFSPSANEILGGVRLTTVRYPEPSAPVVIAGASVGNFYAFDAGQSHAKSKAMLTGPDSIALRHPTIGNAPVAYPNAAGQPTDLIVGGEGALSYYAFSGALDAEGRPRYGAALPVLLERATLYAGSLAVPCVTDWDGDGAHDLVVGNSEGRVLFFKNGGSDRDPRFGLGEPVCAGGAPIHVQPGYTGIQGPFENRWGYTCPAVADWNDDGLPDLLLRGATARHEVFLNAGTRAAPRLAAGRALYCDGLELHGTWRVRPGVARLGNRMGYIMQDDANAFRLYWRADDFNVEDGGPLLMQDGSPITSHTPANYDSPGQRGRSKLCVADWDGDGTQDLIVGTAKRGCIPNPETGLPWSLRTTQETGLQLLFLRNAGTDAAPRFQKPRLFQFRGQDLYLGAHSNAPMVCPFGDTSKGPNLLVGAEDGRIYFFHRDDLTFDPRAEASSGK